MLLSLLLLLLVLFRSYAINVSCGPELQNTLAHVALAEAPALAGLGGLRTAASGNSCDSQGEVYILVRKLVQPE